MQRGSVFWFDPSPTVGREQEKRRPWVCLGPGGLTRYGLYMICPLTSIATPNPRIASWCVPFAPDQVIGDPIDSGFVLVHHIRSISTDRIRPEDFTRTRLRMDVIAAVALVLRDMCEHG